MANFFVNNVVLVIQVSFISMSVCFSKQTLFFRANIMNIEKETFYLPHLTGLHLTKSVYNFMPKGWSGKYKGAILQRQLWKGKNIQYNIKMIKMSLEICFCRYKRFCDVARKKDYRSHSSPYTITNIDISANGKVKFGGLFYPLICRTRFNELSASLCIWNYCE